ncbi:32934_t:CDS:1, partial [Racocetra persica]
MPRKPKIDKEAVLFELSEHIKYLNRCKKRSYANLNGVFDRVIEIFEIYKSNVEDELISVAEFNREKRSIEREKNRCKSEIERLEKLNKELIKENEELTEEREALIKLNKKVQDMIDEKDLEIMRLKAEKLRLQNEKANLIEDTEKLRVMAGVFEWSNKKKELSDRKKNEEIEELRRANMA